MSLYSGVPGQEPATCPNEFPTPAPYKGSAQLIAPQATCTSCSCAAPANQTCTLPDMNPGLGGMQLVEVSNKGCGTVPTYTGELTGPDSWTGGCTTGNGGFAGYVTTCDGPCNVSVSSDPAVVGGGTCPAQGGVLMKTEPTWAYLGMACGDAPVGTGCGAGKFCQPKAPVGFVSNLCVWKDGDLPCPVATFTKKHVFYGDVTDTRACTQCSCNPPVGGTCQLSISVYSDAVPNTCNTLVASFPSGGCTNVLGNPALFGRKFIVSQPPTGGQCTVSGGGVVTGTITPTSSRTFCCMP